MNRKQAIFLIIALIVTVATVGFTQGEKKGLLNCLADNQRELIHYMQCRADCDYAKKIS